MLLSVPACGGDEEPTTGASEGATEAMTTGTTTEEAPTTSTTTSASTPMTTDESESETVAPTTTMPMPVDSDMDGIDDGDDNCPTAANPNQLDFDSNGLGNACDVMVYTGITGTLASSAVADAGLGSCNIPLDFVSTGGTVQVQLDDNAQVARIELTQLDIADILEKECVILIVNATVSIKNFGMSNNVGPFPVQVPHGMADHDAGVVLGTTDLPHPMLALGQLEASTDPNMPPMPSELNLMATLPTFDVDVSGAGDAMMLTWGNNDHVIATSQFMAEGLTIDMEIIGLNGSLMLTK